MISFSAIDTENAYEQKIKNKISCSNYGNLSASFIKRGIYC